MDVDFNRFQASQGSAFQPRCLHFCPQTTLWVARLSIKTHVPHGGHNAQLDQGGRGWGWGWGGESMSKQGPTETEPVWFLMTPRSIMCPVQPSVRKHPRSLANMTRPWEERQAGSPWLPKTCPGNIHYCPRSPFWRHLRKCCILST